MNPTSRHPSWEELAETLRAELRERGGFLHLLNAQQEALLRRDMAGLREATAAIEAHAPVLLAAQHARAEAVAATVGSATPIPVRQLLPAVPEVMRGLFTALDASLHRVNHQARRRMHQNRALLSRFRQASAHWRDPAAVTGRQTYGARGQSTRSAEAGRLVSTRV